MKILLITQLVLTLTLVAFSQSTQTNILIADGTLNKPKKADLQPDVFDLTFNEIEFAGKTVLESGVNFEVLPEMSPDEPKFSIEFSLLDAAEGFFISREIKSRAYLYTAYSKKMNRNYQGIMIVSSLGNSTKFQIKAHYVYRYHSDSFIRTISNITGNSLDEIAIFSNPTPQNGERRYVRIIEFSSSGIEKIGSRLIYSSIPQKQKTPYSPDPEKPAKMVYIPPIVSAIKLYSYKSLGKSTKCYEERLRKRGEIWIIATKQFLSPCEFDADTVNYVELSKPMFPKGIGGN